MFTLLGHFPTTIQCSLQLPVIVLTLKHFIQLPLRALNRTSILAIVCLSGVLLLLERKVKRPPMLSISRLHIPFVSSAIELLREISLTQATATLPCKRLFYEEKK